MGWVPVLDPAVNPVHFEVPDLIELKFSNPNGMENKRTIMFCFDYNLR